MTTKDYQIIKKAAHWATLFLNREIDKVEKTLEKTVDPIAKELLEEALREYNQDLSDIENIDKLDI